MPLYEYGGICFDTDVRSYKRFFSDQLKDYGKIVVLGTESRKIKTIGLDLWLLSLTMKFVKVC
ncbi:MAG: hypothetical protein ACLRR3_01790 [Eubacterium sp.]